MRNAIFRWSIRKSQWRIVRFVRMFIAAWLILPLDAYPKWILFRQSWKSAVRFSWKARANG